MIMKKILLLIFGLFTMLSYSQDNSDAELLLNKVSENIKNYDNIYINYAYTLAEYRRRYKSNK